MYFVFMRPEAAKYTFDPESPEAEAKLKRHILTEQIDVESELSKAVRQSDIAVIAITVKVDEQKKADTTGLVNTCKQVGSALQKGTLVIYGGIAGLGFTAGVMKETLENSSALKAGQDFGLAYSPMLCTSAAAADLQLRVAAADATSFQAAVVILKTLTSKVQEVSDLKTAEAATLFAVAKHDADIALANELAVFCENSSIDYYRVLDTLNLNTPKFRPTIVDIENKNEAYLLLDAAENLNAKLRVPALSRQINEDMIKHAVNLTQEALRSCGKTLRRAAVAVLGVGGCASTISAFVKLIEQKGAKVSLYDPTAKKEQPDGSAAVKSTINETVEGADCIVILSDIEQLSHLHLRKLKSLTKAPSAVVDLAGKFEPQQVETEGFIYIGLGKGTDKK